MSAPEPLDEKYFNWLLSLIRRNSKNDHIALFEHMYKYPFEWFVPNDDNRAEDGRLLREDFLEDTGEYADNEWLELDCSMLELVIGISNRAAFETDTTMSVWFWELLANLSLSEFVDQYYDITAEREVDKILNMLNKRNYDYNGLGGLFPLIDPGKDQRKVEIWYQMSAYLLENNFTA